MNEGSTRTPAADIEHARQDGRREGLAIAAVGVGLIAFLNLLGAEKSVLAIVLALSALSGSSAKLRQRAWIALGLGLLHLATLAAVLILFQDELGQLIQLLHTLG